MELHYGWLGNHSFLAFFNLLGRLDRYDRLGYGWGKELPEALRCYCLCEMTCDG